jgi:hypothetical protein
VVQDEGVVEMMMGEMKTRHDGCMVVKVGAVELMGGMMKWM